jgi:hypothetical protein
MVMLTDNSPAPGPSGKSFDELLEEKIRDAVGH